MKIATLGPEGTVSHEAVIKYDSKSEIIFKNTIWDVFEAVKSGCVSKGIVPMENSISGSVGLTFDALMEFELGIVQEIIIPVKHNLASLGKIGEIKRIFSNLQAFAQCEKFIREKLPSAEIVPVASNAKAAEELAKINNREYAAIVPNLAMKKYSLKCVAKEIQDSRFNVTRFVVICKKRTKKTGTDRTSVSIYPHLDKPGLLYSLIGEFASRKINLTKIESRPSKGRLGDYIFFIDLQGHVTEAPIRAALESIERSCFVKVLGSYPREY